MDDTLFGQVVRSECRSVGVCIPQTDGKKQIIPLRFYIFQSCRNGRLLISAAGDVIRSLPDPLREKIAVGNDCF